MYVSDHAIGGNIRTQFSHEMEGQFNTTIKLWSFIVDVQLEQFLFWGQHNNFLIWYLLLNVIALENLITLIKWLMKLTMITLNGFHCTECRLSYKKTFLLNRFSFTRHAIRDVSRGFCLCYTFLFLIKCIIFHNVGP